jgi:hypothetical protein
MPMFDATGHPNEMYRKKIIMDISIKNATPVSYDCGTRDATGKSSTDLDWVIAKLYAFHCSQGRDRVLKILDWLLNKTDGEIISLYNEKYIIDTRENDPLKNREIKALYDFERQLKSNTNKRSYHFQQMLHSMRRCIMPPGSRMELFTAHAYGMVRSAAKSLNPWNRNKREQHGTSAAQTFSAAKNDSIEIDSSVSPVAEHAAVAARLKNLLYSPNGWSADSQNPLQEKATHLVIFSPVHRSGSTLLQRICNARKGTLIWGEHGGFLTHFSMLYVYAAFFSVTARHERINYFSSGEDPNLWIANMSPDLHFIRRAVIDSARAFLDTMYGQYRDNHDIIGFKEVRYGRNEFELLRQCCPNIKVLCLVRNPVNTWNSTPRSWYPSLNTWIKQWNNNVQDYINLARENTNCHLIRHEDVVRREKNTMHVLEDTAKVTPEQIEMVLKNKIGSNQKGISDEERQTIIRECGKTMAALGYL